MRGNVFMVLMGADVDPAGNPLALVVYRNRSYEYVPHSELVA